MKQLLYAMNFIGRTSKMSHCRRVLKTTGSATSCTMSTTICSTGVECNLIPLAGDLAYLESELSPTGQGEFEENGTLTFGHDGRHVLRFTTAGKGHLGWALEPGATTGAASWRVEGGEGQLVAARGFITSNFVIDGSGRRSDFQCGLIFFAE
jgi:hypothetical protein